MTILVAVKTSTDLVIAADSKVTTSGLGGVCKINCASALSEYTIERKGRNTNGEEKTSITS